MSKPVLYSCEGCHCKIELTLQSLLRVYFTEPLVDHIKTTCPECGKEMILWDLHRMVIINALSRDPDTALTVQIDVEAARRIWQKYAKSKDRTAAFCAAWKEES